MSYALASYGDFPEAACRDPNAYSPEGDWKCVCKPGFTCADPPIAGSCHTCVATAQSGAGTAAMRASCAATGGTWMTDGWCYRAGQSEAPPADPSPSSDDPGSSWWDSAPSSGGGGGGSWSNGGGDGTTQAGMGTVGWFAVAAGVMAVGLFAFDAMTGAGVRR